MRLGKILLSVFVICSLTGPVYAGSGVGGNAEMLFVPLGTSGENDTRSYTLMYGVNAYTELHENWRISYGISASVYNGSLFAFPFSIAYVPTDNYKINLRPQIFAGIEPIFSNFPDFSGLKFYGFLGLGLDYIFDNLWYLDFGAKLYINNSFFQETVETNSFNTGSLSIYAGAGWKY